MMRYAELDEVIGRANDTSYGLGGAVWSQDTNVAIAVAHRLDTGNVWVNSNTGISPLTPAGGAKQSGIGVESGLAGLREYTRSKAIWVAKT
jgi:acyl-CoA reductase-like NAD-dependent aldehyde dehydrogenase